MAAKALKLRAEVRIISNRDKVNSIKAIVDWSFIVKVTFKAITIIYSIEIVIGDLPSSDHRLKFVQSPALESSSPAKDQ